MMINEEWEAMKRLTELGGKFEFSYVASTYVIKYTAINKIISTMRIGNLEDLTSHGFFWRNLVSEAEEYVKTKLDKEQRLMYP